jgi:hypothetical protein
VTALASASDNVGVAKVNFYLGNSLRCTVTTAPYSCKFQLPSGKRWSGTIEARAYDAAGNIGSSSIQLSTTR